MHALNRALAFLHSSVRVREVEMVTVDRGECPRGHNDKQSGNSRKP